MTSIIQQSKMTFVLLSTLLMTLELRIATPQDAQAILQIYAPYCTSTQVSFETVAPTEKEMHDRIARIVERFPWIIAEVDGAAAGYVYASQHRERAAYRWVVDVAVYIADAHHRRGLARALYASLFSILRKQGFVGACAGITLPNPGSVALHESVGFRPVGVFSNVGYKLGDWLDVGWWRLELQPATHSPAEPQDFRTMRDDAAVAEALAEGKRLALSHNYWRTAH
jgi:L-amino acid N-acyltransferase YncA